jgi:hypothetical protein
LTKFSGDDVGGAIPDPISNSEVKPSRADGTARARAWESRSLPGLFLTPRASPKDSRGVSLSVAPTALPADCAAALSEPHLLLCLPRRLASAPCVLPWTRGAFCVPSDDRKPLRSQGFLRNRAHCEGLWCSDGGRGRAPLSRASGRPTNPADRSSSDPPSLLGPSGGRPDRMR